MHYHSHEKEACDHEQAKIMISFLDESTTPIGGHEDIKRTDFVYFGIEEIKRSEMLNEEWLREAKKARLVAANARQHLQEMKDKVNLLNMARQKGIDNIRRLLAQGKDALCDEIDKLGQSKDLVQFEVSSCCVEVDHSFVEDDVVGDDTLSGSATQELFLEGNEGIYNSSLDWLPISYDRAAIYLLVGDLLSIPDGDSEFGRSSTLFSHDDYHLIQDFRTCCVLEMGGIRVAQREAMGGGSPTVWAHQIYHRSFGVELIQQDVLVLQELFGDIWDITQIFTWDPSGDELHLLLRFLGDKQF